jgi:glycine cleavage system H protein
VDEGQGIAKLGISSYAQDQLGEVVYCDLPSAGAKFTKGQTLCTLESVKAVGEVYTPMDSEVVAVNDELASKPNLVNESPEDEGWLLKLGYSGSFDVLSKQWKDAKLYKESLQG